MAGKVQQGMEGISSFSLPELTLPHFDGSGWNFLQAALAGGGTTRTTNRGGVYITVNGYNAGMMMNSHRSLRIRSTT